MSLITIIVPCYNEEEALPIFYDEFNKVANEMSSENFELLLVNDGSKDNTVSVMKSSAAMPRRRPLSGKSPAAGAVPIRRIRSGIPRSTMR